MSLQPEVRVQYYHQKKWIANHFLIKNNLNNILKNRLKKTAETLRPELAYEQTPIHFRSTKFSN
jgi:hypothetical protein